MFWRRFPFGELIIALGVGVVIAICLPPHCLAVLLGLALIGAGIKLLCK